MKEATTSVLETHLEPSRYEHPGQRVVEGQRMMQAASDMFLGWSTSVIDGRHYYWRQLRDMKGSAEIEASDKSGLTAYARICGWSLARAHARSGEPVMIAGYLGKSDSFDRAIAEFARRYAAQNDLDFAAHAQAVADGSTPATLRCLTADLAETMGIEATTRARRLVDRCVRGALRLGAAWCVKVPACGPGAWDRVGVDDVPSRTRSRSGRVLEIPPSVTQVCLLAVGYYTGDSFTPTPRRLAAEVT